MKKLTPTLIAAIIAISPVFLLGGCGKFIKREATINVDRSQDPGSNDQSGSSCGPTQVMGSYTPAWVFTACEKQEWIHVWQGSVNAAGEQLGTRPVSRGMLSVRYYNMHNDTISYSENFGLFFMAEGVGGGEANWQWMSYNMGSGNIQSRLVIQRFDGTCPRFCEQADITDELQFTDFLDVHQFDCEWDTSVSKLACTITKIGDPTLKIVTLNDPMGPYSKINYLGFGQRAFDGAYESYRGLISDVKVTIFQ